MAHSFGARELDVMTVLWMNGPSTVAEVRERLPARLAYTTVLTILRNLEAKDVAGHEEEGKAHRYFARVGHAAARESALTRVIDTLFGGRPEGVLAHLVETRGLDPQQLRELQALLERRLAEDDDAGGSR